MSFCFYKIDGLCPTKLLTFTCLCLSW